MILRWLRRRAPTPARAHAPEDLEALLEEIRRWTRKGRDLAEALEELVAFRSREREPAPLATAPTPEE